MNQDRKQKANEKIEEFVEGSSDRTLMQASIANEVVSALNRLLTLKGMNGIEVKWSDSNVVISLNQNLINGKLGGSDYNSLNSTSSITAGSGSSFNYTCNCRYS